MLLPAAPFAKKGESITIIYQWGHPFEHELFEAPRPTSVMAFTPDGQTLELASKLEKTRLLGADKKTVAAYRFQYVPEHRGDHRLVLTTPPIFLEGSNEFVQDIVEVVLHVTTQKGWDTDHGGPLRIVPLTRPYGLYPGMVMQARVLMDDGAKTQPFKDAPVEFERYNPETPKELPMDERITFKTKTDGQGILTVTLPDPGWWCAHCPARCRHARTSGNALPRQAAGDFVGAH